MPTILDVDLSHEFWGDVESARRAAAIEAANTGGAVIGIDAVEILPRSLTFIGTIPESAIANPDPTGPTRLGSFHTTWGSVLNPAGIIGFLVVGHPVRCSGREINDSGLSRVSVSLDRTFTTIPTRTLGPVCCARCRQPISAERLRALPATRVCTGCRAISEEIIYAP
jgi:DksA/TraR C4-type zinc finger protein